LNQIKVKKLHKNAQLPKRATPDSAGADLYACIETATIIPPHESVLIGTGIAAEIPLSYAGFIFARSGIASRRGLAPSNKVGVIDSDYRGEIKISLHNHTDVPQQVQPSERIAQLIIAPYLMAEYIEVDEVKETVRGIRGFGSSGSY
jgi:dUTP pyrophosphatase